MGRGRAFGAAIVALWVAACGARTELFDGTEEVSNVAVDGSGVKEADGAGSSFDAQSRDSGVVGFDSSAEDAGNIVDAGATDADASADADADGDADADANADADADADADANEDAGADAGGCVIYVDAVHGDDSNDGSSQHPFKSITSAIASVPAFDACVPTIQVRPGTYDEANGEVFPISVPPRVTLVGDEARKGDPNGSPVLVRGGGDVFGPIWGAIVAGSGATIAGLDVVGVDSLEAGAILGTGVLLDFGRSDVVVRNNTFSGAHVGLYVHGAQNVLATNNVFTGNNNGFSLVAGSAKVEHNVSTNNAYGFETDTGGADFGGGALGSAGGNTISCNGLDVWVSVGGVSMTNNFWDHVPPVSSAGAGPKDIYLFAGATAPITTGAKLATPACP